MREDYEQEEFISKYRKIFSSRKAIGNSRFGAGSRKGESAKLAGISIRPKYGRMLYRLARFINPAEVIELGTGVGVSTGYLAAGAPNARIITVEGSVERSKMARSHLKLAGIENVEFKQGLFSDFLKEKSQIKSPLIAFIDGNHKYKPTLEYANYFIRDFDQPSIIVFDDIRWSGEMSKAWEDIKRLPFSGASIDLFFMGIIVLKKNMVKQHYILKF